ncbi:hypothetical protein IGJ55_003327 [Enterococcus sp. AZ170]|uniref:hypothetical protein n=1 Tax=Enterococcus TaxID=1350 RepID=UPI001A92FDC5|nr:hypothetical protein [Enterococcus ureilyticus]MBO0447633.1 hypothetical protein [Enterococcus ureilyticus]
MSKSYLFLIYTLVIIFSIAGFVVVKKTIFRESFIDLTKVKKEDFEYTKKHQGKVDIFIKITGNIFTVILFWSYILPGLKDLPAVLTEDYQLIEGTAITRAGIGNRREPTVVTIAGENGETVRLRFYTSEPIEKGDTLKVIYLPNLKRGTLLTHLSE